jgi:hypothetical protein
MSEVMSDTSALLEVPNGVVTPKAHMNTAIQISRPLLRRAAKKVLEGKLGYLVEIDEASSRPDGARLVARAAQGTLRIAVRTGLSRRMRATRNEDGRWRTLSDADLVVVAVPAWHRSDAVEVLGFSPQSVLDALNVAFERAPHETAPGAPVILALDEKVRNSRRSMPAGLKSQALWSYVLPIQDPALAHPAEAIFGDGFVERVKREFAQIVGVDVEKVIVEFKIIA